MQEELQPRFRVAGRQNLEAFLSYRFGNELKILRRVVYG